jgi:ASC-1-like (ASCH) protein
MNKRHFLKTIQPYYQQVVDGEKKFELRINDRNYKVGDHLVLMEYDYIKGELTQRLSEYKATNIFADAEYGISNGFVVISIEPLLTETNEILKTIKSEKLKQLGINAEYVLGS